MKKYFLLVLSSMLSHYINVQANSAVCFLTYQPAYETIRFAEELAEDAIHYDVDVFIMIDDNNFNFSNINVSYNLRFLQISNQECISYGYQKTISLNGKWREVTSWDKALLCFCVFNKNYSFVWLIENDVFIPNVQAFRSLHQLYSNTSDLIVPRNGLNLLGNTSSWLWDMATGKFVPPWSNSMVNVVGLSRRMLTAVDDYVMWRGEVPFHEFFFNTLAIQLNFTIVSPTELSTIVFSATHSLEQARKQPNNLWHPFKDLKVQNTWRERLANESSKHNNHIQLTDLEMLCDNKTKMTNFLNNFEISKSQRSSNSRLSMRQRFFHLAEQCQKRNASIEVVSLAMKLADHAYKLPEPPIEKLLTKKSSNHLRLDEALKENKESIFELSSNSSLVNELRKQATSLIKELTSEIQREFEQEQLQNPTQSLKKKRIFFILRRQINSSNLDFSKNNMKINSLLFFMFCLLFLFLWWNEIEKRKFFAMMFIYLLFFLLLQYVI